MNGENHKNHETIEKKTEGNLKKDAFQNPNSNN